MKNFLIKNREKISLALLVIVSSLIIIPFVIMAIYSRPCVDDYSYSTDIYHLVKAGEANPISLIKTAWNVDKYFYNNWQGLYTSAFILALQPGVFGEKYYFIGAIILLLLIFACVRYFLNTVSLILTKEKCPRSTVISMGIEAFILLGIPEITEGLYWFNGAWNYTPFFFLILLNVAWLLRFSTAEAGKSRWVYLFLSIMISFLISGGNHVTGFLNILVVAVFCFAVLIINWRKTPAILSLISSVIGFWIMYKAPGTAIRQSNFEQPAIKETIKQSILELKSLANSYVGIQWILLMIVAVYVGKKLVDNLGSQKDIFEIQGSTILRFITHPVICILVSAGIICGILCVPYYAMGNFGQGRVYNIFWLTFMTLSFLNVCYFVIWKNHRDNHEPKEKSKLFAISGMVAGFLLVTMLLASTNYSAVIRELHDGTAKAYAEVCDSRYAKMADAVPGDVCYSGALPLSECLYLSDVSWDNASWENQAWTKYYGVGMVLVE